MCAARLLPRGRCAVRLNSRRRYAPVLPLLAVARVGRVACCRMAPVQLLRRGTDCRPLRSAALTAPRPPSAGIVPTCGPLLPSSALCVRCACVAAVIRRGPLSRYACYDCNNYIDLHYILYLQYCTIRNDYKPFMHCIIWSIWHFFREFLGSESLVNQRFAGYLSLHDLREKSPYVKL